MCRKITTMTTATFSNVAMDDEQRAAFDSYEKHMAASEYLMAAVASLRHVSSENGSFSALTKLEMSVVGHARDIIYAAWGSVEERRNEMKTTSRRLEHGMKAMVLADVGEPEDVEFPARGVRSTVIAVDGEFALLTFTMVEDREVNRYYLVADQEFITPSHYDNAGPENMRITVHCSPDSIVWALDLDERWPKLMTDAGRKTFREAMKDCERAMAAATVTHQ